MYRTFHIKDINTHETDNVYYNVIQNHSEITYTITTGATGPLYVANNENTESINYDVTRDIPILDKASDYYASVLRFAIPLNAVPIMVMNIIPNQPNINLTPFIVGITYLGVNYSVNLIYFNRSDSPLQYTPVQNQPEQVITPYYYVNTFEQFIDMINYGYAEVWLLSGLSAVFPSYIPPYFVYNYSGTLQLVIPDCFVRVVSPLSTIPELYLNLMLEEFMPAFEYFFHGTNQPNGRDLSFLLNRNQGYTGASLQPILSAVTPYYPLGITPPPASPYAPPTGLTGPVVSTDYWQITGEYNVYPLWVSLRKIVLVSNTMPIRQEGIPSANPSNPGLASGLPIFADFVPNIDLAGDSRSIAFYNPSAQYKLVDLMSDLPLQKIDIQVFWQDKNENLYPIQLTPEQTVSIKIGFFRKNLYKNFREKVEGQSF